ncbi:MAG: Cof-like hydrolase [Frankiales bacterium]|nr:Cof-like hydrolase [Frankiales bacterium]
MNPAPKLVATDLDGTLVGSDGKVSARNAAAVAAVERAGVPFVMVTGRPPRWMAEISRQTAHRGLAICANGALLYDLHTERVLRSSLLEEDVAVEVVTALRMVMPDIAFAVEFADTGFGHEPGYVPSYPWPDRTEAHAEELVVGGVVKLLARRPGMSADALLAAARDAVGDRATFTHSSADGLLEISATGVTKATGLAAYAEELGILAADVVAFGDMPNDLPLLAWAGTGVAVANAHGDVLAAADEVTGSNDDDGVAQVLERWF